MLPAILFKFVKNMYITLLGNENGLLSYWQFNDGIGTTLKDVIGGHDGDFTKTWMMLIGFNSTAPLPFETTTNGNWGNQRHLVDGAEYTHTCLVRE